MVSRWKVTIEPVVDRRDQIPLVPNGVGAHQV